MWKKINKLFYFFNQDLEAKIFSYWNKIPPIYKKSFLWSFVVVNLIFLWHTISFLPDNHSLDLIKSGMNLTYQFSDRNGRFSSGVVQQFFNGDILPIINNLFCYIGFILAMIYLCHYWQLPKTAFIYILSILFVILLPYTLPWIYFTRHMTYFWSIFAITFGLSILLNQTFISFVLALSLFVLSYGTYVSMVQILLIAFSGRCLLDYIFNHYTLKRLLKTYWKTVLCIFLSAVIFVIIELYLKHKGMLGSQSQTNIHILDSSSIKLFFNSFTNELPFMQVWFRTMLTLPIFLVMFYTWIKEQYISLFLIIGILILSQLTILFAQDNYSNTVRVLFFTFPWLYLLFLVILFKLEKCWKNIAILIMIISVYHSSLQDLRWQKSFVLETQQEIQTYRIISETIKHHPNFISNKLYTLIIFGQVNTKGMFYKNYKIFPGNNHYFNSNFSPYWQPYQIFNLIEQQTYIKNCYSSPNDISQKTLQEMDMEYILQKAKPYPHPNSIHVDNEFIYVFLDEGALIQLKNKFQDLKQ